MAFETKYPAWVKKELKKNDVALTTFYERVKRGYSLEESVMTKKDFDKKAKRRKVPKWVLEEGIKNGLAKGTIYKRIQYGYSYEEAIQPGTKKGFNKRDKFLYMIVTADAYELPIAIFENIEDIAKYLNIKESTVRSQVSRSTNGAITNRKIRKVRYINEDC